MRATLGQKGDCQALEDARRLSDAHRTRVGGMFDRAGIGRTRAAGLTICFLKIGFARDLSDVGYPVSPTWIKRVPLNVDVPVVSTEGEPSRILIRDTEHRDHR